MYLEDKARPVRNLLRVHYCFGAGAVGRLVVGALVTFRMSRLAGAGTVEPAPVVAPGRSIRVTALSPRPIVISIKPPIMRTNGKKAKHPHKAGTLRASPVGARLRS